MNLTDIADELGKLFNSAKSSVSNFVQQPIRIAQQGIQNWAQQNPQQAQKIINIPQQIQQYQRQVAVNKQTPFFNNTGNNPIQWAGKVIQDVKQRGPFEGAQDLTYPVLQNPYISPLVEPVIGNVRMANYKAGRPNVLINNLLGQTDKQQVNPNMPPGAKMTAEQDLNKKIQLIKQVLNNLGNSIKQHQINNVNQTNQGLKQWGNVVNRPFDIAGQQVQQAKSKLPSNMGKFQQAVNLLPTAASALGNNFLQNKTLNAPFAYIANRMVNPLLSIPGNVTNAVTDIKKGNYGGATINTGMGVLNTLYSVGNLLNPVGTQAGMAPFLGMDVAKGNLLAQRKGMSPQDKYNTQLNAFTGEKVPGAGETLTDNPTLAKGIDVAEQVGQLAIPAYMGIKGYYKNKQIQADAIKSFSEDVKNVIHPINMGEGGTPPPSNPLIKAFQPIFNMADESVKNIRDAVGGFQEKPNLENATRLQMFSKQYLNTDPTTSPTALSNIWNYLLSVKDGVLPKTVPKDLMPLHLAILKQYSKGAAFPSPNDINVGLSTKPLTKAEHIKMYGTQPPVEGGVGGVKIKPAQKIQISPQTSTQPVGQTPLPPETNPLLPKVETSLPSSIPQKERGFVTSVKGSPDITNPTKVGVSGTYVPKPNEQLMGEAKSLLNEGTSINFKATKNLDQKVSATIQQAINLDKAGQHEAAANLYNNLSEHGTELGRGVQAFSMLDKMSPEAIALSTAGKIKNYNLTATRKIPELTGDQVKLISDQVAKIDSLTGREKNIAINDLHTTINNFIPSSLTDKAITVWKAGLLTSLRTHERNLLGNTIMGGSEVVKDIPASFADQIMALKTGKRSTTFTTKGTVGGVGKGLQAWKDIATTGFDPEQAISKYDVKTITWGNNPFEQALKKYTDVVFRTLAGADKPFWNGSFARSLYDQAGAEAINVGKQGDRAFMENLVKNPTEQMLTTATVDANTATFHDKNALSSVANSMKRALSKNDLTRLGGEILAPFTGVPSSIVGKTIAYSPIGLVQGAIKMGRVLVGQVPELQRQAAQEVGRGVVGTGLFGIGAYLMSKGLLTGQPKDAKEADLWATQGKQANSILIGGKWRSINSIGPQFLVSLAGAKYQEEMGKPGGGDIGAYAGGLAKDQLSQTFLAGVQGPLNAVTDPARYGKSYFGNQAASVIPNIVKDTSKAFDPNVRENNTFTDYLKSGIPGVRNTLQPKRDVLGNIIPQEPTGVGAFFDLFNSKTPIDNATVNELDRLNNVGSDATPSKQTASQTILKQKVKLTFDQLNNLEAGVGQVIKPQLEQLISDPNYQKLSDEEKMNAINKLVTNSRTVYKNRNAFQITGGTIGQANNSYLDQNGAYKQVDTTPIAKPNLTGNSVIDKKLMASYNTAVANQATGLAKSQQNNQPNYGKGNIDLNNRPIIHNSDGSISTVRSITITDDNGQAILIPTVRQGLNRLMTNQEAIDWYNKTGEYLGKFKSEDEANAYAETLHEDQAKQYLPDNQTQQTKYSYVDENGAYKTVDLTPIKFPTLTGDTVVDKKLKSAYYASINAQMNDVIKLGQSGTITQQQMIDMVNNLNDTYTSGKAAKKPKKITIAKIKVPKLSTSKFSLKIAKISKPPNIKIAKAMKIKPIKIAKQRKITLQKLK